MKIEIKKEKSTDPSDSDVRATAAAGTGVSALPPAASVAAIHVLKGVVYRDSDEETWRDVLHYQAVVRDYLRGIRLELLVDESEGYAFVRQIPASEDTDADGREIPRLVQKRPLGYSVSLLCVLLRKRLAEQDAAGGDVRLILSRDQILEMARVFLPSTNNEARTEDLVDKGISKLIEYGFLRRLRGGTDDLFEIRRIIKALVDASWLSKMNEKLEEYRKHADDAL